MPGLLPYLTKLEFWGEGIRALVFFRFGFEASGKSEIPVPWFLSPKFNLVDKGATRGIVYFVFFFFSNF